MATMFSMIILTSSIIFISKIYKLKLSVFPQKFSLEYVLFSTFFLIILVLTPSNFSGNIEDLLLLIYSSLVIPLYEEIIFRGIIWNQLEKLWTSKIIVYFITILLFGIWHIGYISSIAFRVSDGLITAMVWKVVTGSLFGLVLGFVRLRTKNCYSTMLVHGFMNIFGR